jgi:flagellar motor protein MotB
MRSLLLPLILCPLLGAVPISVTVEGPFEEALYGIGPGKDGSIAAVGFTTPEATAAESGETYYDPFEYLAAGHARSGEQMRFIRLDGSGGVTADRTFDLRDFSRAVSIVGAPSGGYHIGGYTHAGELLIAEVGGDGSTRRLRRFGTPGVDRMSRLVGLRDGGSLVIGTSRTFHDGLGDLFAEGLGGSDLYLVRFAPSGALLWSRKYGTAAADRGISAVEAEDGTLMLLGASEHNTSEHPFVLHLTPEGDTIAKRRFDNREDTEAGGLIALRDGTYAVSLSQHQSGAMRFVRFDRRLNILGDRELPIRGGGALHALAERSDGTLVGVGEIAAAPQGNVDALAVTLSGEGKLLWQRRYGGPNRDLFRDVAVLDDGSAVAVGARTPPGSERSDMWIVTLEPDGPSRSVGRKPGAPLAPSQHASGALPDKGGAIGTAIYNALLSSLAGEIGSGSLTLTRDLRLTLSSPLLRFETGVHRLTPEQRHFLDRITPKLLGVLYDHRTGIDALAINGHTSSEWAGATPAQRHLNNAALSAMRAYSVLERLVQVPENAPYREWLATLTRHSGYAYTEPVEEPEENRRASRRVTFDIVLK